MNHHQLKSYFSFHFATRGRLIQRKEIKNDKLKLMRRSEQQEATVCINLISDFCSGQQENPNNPECQNPKNVNWLKGTQPSKLPSAMETIINFLGKMPDVQYALILLNCVQREQYSLFVAKSNSFCCLFSSFTLEYTPQKGFLHYHVSIDAMQKMQCQD